MKKRKLLLVGMLGIMLTACNNNPTDVKEDTTMTPAPTTFSEENNAANESNTANEANTSAADNTTNTDNTSAATTPEATPTPEPATKRYSVTTQELIIQNGDKEIYGKLYLPESDTACPAIILSHGYNGAHNDFATDCNYFAANGYIAYAYDFCGGSTRSKSSGASTDMTIFTEKEDLLAVFDYISAMEQVDSERVFLMGGSQGGLVTTLATEERADKIKGVALYYPALNVPDDWRRNYPEVDTIPETTDFWGLTLGKNFFTSIHDFYTFENIGTYDKNILIIHGDNDQIVPLSYSQQAIELYPHAELIVLPGEGHGYSPAGSKTARESVLKFMQEQ